MNIRITNKMKEKFKIVLTDENDNDVERFESWHANIFTFQRKTGIIMMNDLTRYGVILFGIKRSDINNLGELIKEQLKRNMKSDGFDDLSIQKLIRSIGNISYNKTNDRSILGQIKDNLFALGFYIDPEETLTEEVIQVVNDRINDTPMRALEKDGFEAWPVSALKKALREK